jgi:hypothetical protein
VTRVDERKPENRIESYPYWRLDVWSADHLPKGRIERIYTHWSAREYESVFPAYHYCIAMRPGGEILVVETNDVRANMRDVRVAGGAPYAAHTFGRNSFAIGISIMAMSHATPEDFGPHPLTVPLVDALCRVGAGLARHYGIAIDPDHVMSHAEAALHDGYFGSAPEERWDIARLRPHRAPLEPYEAVETGDMLRAAMREHAR